MAELELIVGIDFSWTGLAYLGVLLRPPAPPPGLWSYSYPGIARHYEKWSTLYEEYWCTDEEIKGQVVRYYSGTYWAYTTKHAWSSGIEYEVLTDEDPGF
jgi:hypothetical protein